ncbi:putative WD-repeat protein [Capsicum annuum]|nr:putative WD-repeat protein [Capsicum annuum]KAF3673122.1 putative WD-repeat protein [Capsicum annuum]
MPSIIRAPAARKATTLTVAVKCRPLTDKEGGRDIVRVNNDKGVYERSIQSTIAGVIQGLNATVFAYGSTGSGKTYTMVGTKDDPGLMVLSLNTIFNRIKNDKSSDVFQVTCSYLEVYNEVIYDLLEKSSGHLELREDPEQGIVVHGLRCIKVNSADKILELLNLGNSRRKTESTEVNETSSRSHAVLEITVTRKQRDKYSNQVIRGKLALVDLAGSERACETNSGGQKLRDGANINRSLLALANCINALGKQQKKGLAYVPYRNSKLTRILKDGLSGNSQTIMIATISPAVSQYHHTVNTLKYADRAKEIKTHIQKNIGTINTHVSDYQRMIDSLQNEVSQLRKELDDKETQLIAKPTEKASDDELSWLDTLSHETSENVQDRINLQKALFEIEEMNISNRNELQNLDDGIAKQQAVEKDGAVVRALRARRQVILDNIRDNDELSNNYLKEIEANEKRRCELQAMIDEAISNNGNKTYLRVLSQYRLLGIANTELQLEIAMRDQILHNQREAQKNLWNLLLSLGLDEKQITDLALKQGITIEDWTMTGQIQLSDRRQSPNTGNGTYTTLSSSPPTFQLGANVPLEQYFCSMPISLRNRRSPHINCRGEDNSSCHLHDCSPSESRTLNEDESCFKDGTSSLHEVPSRRPLEYCSSYPPPTRNQFSSCSESGISMTPSHVDFAQQQLDVQSSSIRQQIWPSYHAEISSSGYFHHRVSRQGRFHSSPLTQNFTSVNSNHVLPKLGQFNLQEMQVLPSCDSTT